MIVQLNPAIPVKTPKGNGILYFLIDDLPKALYWVCSLDDNGEFWTFNIDDIRTYKNLTQNTENISPLYNPDDVAFKKENVNYSCDQNENGKCKHATHLLYLRCNRCNKLDSVFCKDIKTWKCMCCFGGG